MLDRFGILRWNDGVGNLFEGLREEIHSWQRCIAMQKRNGRYDAEICCRYRREYCTA